MRSREEREQDIQYLKSMIYYAVEVNERLNRAKRYNMAPNDEMVVESVALLLSQVGEQLDRKKMSVELQEKYQGNPINFSAISKFRNKAYHHYGSMNTQGILANAKEMDLFYKQVKNLQIIPNIVMSFTELYATQVIKIAFYYNAFLPQNKLLQLRGKAYMKR